MAETVLDKEKDEGFCCKLCSEIYSENLRPHSLPCGHSFCTGCIINFLTNGILACPKCKQEYKASSERDFPINYDLEELMSDSRFAKAEKMVKGQTIVIGNKMKTFITDQRNSSLALIQETNDLKSQIRGYDDYLNSLAIEHEECIKKIHEVAQRHGIIMKMIHGEQNVLKGMMEELDKREKVFQPKVENLEKAINSKATLYAVCDVEDTFSSLEELNESCRQKFPNGNIIITSRKALREVQNALSLIDPDGTEISSELPDLSTSKFTLQEKIRMLEGRGTMTLKKLQTMSKVTEKNIKEGFVYAVQTQEDRSRSAKLSLEDDKLYLHYLKNKAGGRGGKEEDEREEYEGDDNEEEEEEYDVEEEEEYDKENEMECDEEDEELPSNAHTIMHCVLMENLYKYSAVVFMDLAWGGTVRGRVHILLAPLTPFAKQFLALCTGELGPSYAGSKFFNVLAKNNSVHEQVAAGDYERNDGSGGGSVLTGLEKDVNQYTRPWLAGSVSFYNAIGHANSAPFKITTGYGNPSSTQNNIFGQVQDGLDLVKQATKVIRIQDVEIVDCGVIVPL